MKVQIIHLEAHDDYISTRDKMGWIKTGQIVLVWPPRGRILSRKLDLILLQRHSKSMGVKFALVTTDSDVIQHAGELGIPIFENVRQSMESHWRSKRRKIVRIEHERILRDPVTLRSQAPHHTKEITANPGIRAGTFAIGLIAVLALIGFFIPSARLKLIPMHKQQQIKMTVLASPSSTGINITGEIPAVLMTTIVEGKDMIATTGSMYVPDKFAIGGVLFTNITEDEIEIPEGTIISTLGTEPIRFTTTKAGQVAGGIGKNITLPARAILPGEESNVPAESILAIEGPLGLKLSVLNPMRTHGGNQTIVPSASAKDMTALHQNLMDELEVSALNEFRTQLNQGDLLIEDSLKLGKIIDEIFDPPEDQPANQLELTLQLEYEIFIIKESEINSLAQMVLDANLPDHYLAISDTVDVQPLNEPTVDKDGTIFWQLMLERDIKANIDSMQVITMILGLPVNQASQRLMSTFDLQSSPDITLNPSWWPKIPYLPFRVQISNLE